MALLLTALRRATTPRSTLTTTTLLRYASTKHPQNFTPPSQDDLAELRERTIEFARREITPEVAQKTDHENEFPHSMWKKLGDAGLLGVTADEQYGGLSMGYQAHCVILEELSRASGSIGLSYAAHSQLCVNQIMLNGNEEQKAQYLPGLVSGETIGALAMSEHSAGSDVVSMRMTAKPVDGGYLLNGTKMWITNGPDAGLVVVYAKTEPEKGSRGMTAFLVETHNPNNKTPVEGFSVARKLDKLGMRGSNTGELLFDNVFVPSSSILGELNRGVKVLMEGLDLERLVLSAGPLGLMQAALDVTLPYIDEHHEDPEIKTQDCAGAILYAAERATECGMDAIQCLGGMGYMNEMAAGRIMRDAKLYEIGAGTSEIRRMVIGRAFNKEFGLGR
ncbi:hypothetical protein LTR22_006938 [Elasticomyces elasticus]|nr:hypothetical protein LTR22_006938 [Elasticomyces elasticus]KAK4916151.1 hypothetical protein LTR49_015792 [Elasticomyces elasticus]KAK5767937.1 hypothetical protein LTS12_001754 [Elasticomyces elasticus]